MVLNNKAEPNLKIVNIVLYGYKGINMLLRSVKKKKSNFKPTWMKSMKLLHSLQSAQIWKCQKIYFGQKHAGKFDKMSLVWVEICYKY